MGEAPNDSPREGLDELDAGLPSRIGRFIVLGSLGRGGMGVVVRAYDPTLDRQVAIKLLHTNLQERQHRRLLREAQSLARLSHPNVVQVYEVGEYEHRLFIAMELVPGQTLFEWNELRHSWRQCLDVYAQAGHGLIAAHTKELIHRDFKPVNCIIDKGGRVRVLDFGLARGGAANSDDADDPASPEPGLSEEERERIELSQSYPRAFREQLTRAGTVVGTLGYMAPEQMRGKPTDARTDQFSFCVSLYEAIFGVLPFDSPLDAPTSGKSSGHPRPLRRPPGSPRIPRWLQRALTRGLQYEPQMRWPSMAALIDELENRRRRGSWGWIALGATTVAAAATATSLRSAPSLPPSPCADAAQTLADIEQKGWVTRVDTALRSTQVSYAGETASRATQELEAYGDRLSKAYVEACEATEIRSEETREELELRRACLDERAHVLRRTITTLSNADQQVVERAVESVIELPGLRPCADGSALLAAMQVEPPRAGAERDKLRELRRRLGTTQILRTLGKTAEALEALGPIVTSAEEFSAPRLHAEALLLMGLLRADLGEHDQAQQHLRRALELSLSHGADTIGVETLSVLASLVAVDQAETNAGLWLGEVAHGLVERVDSDLRLKAQVFTAMGEVRGARGEYSQGEARFRQAIDLLSREFGEDHLTLAEPLDGLGVMLRRQDRAEEASEQYLRALELRRRWQGKQHPQVAHQLINLAAVMNSRKRYEQAVRYGTDALAILERDPAPRDEEIAHARTNLGASLAKLDRHDEAQHELKHAVAAWESVLGPQHPKVATACINLAAILIDSDRREDSLEQYERALSILEANEATSENRALTLFVLERLVRQNERLEHSQRALDHQQALEKLRASRP